MGKALDRSAGQKQADGSDSRDWRRGMSNHVAYALLVYTGIHIFVTVGAMKDTGMKSLSLLALVILVVGIIPACRAFERRWVNLSNESAADPALAPAFRRDLILLWGLAIGLPFAFTGIFRFIASVI